MKIGTAVDWAVGIIATVAYAFCFIKNYDVAGYVVLAFVAGWNGATLRYRLSGWRR